MNNTDFFLYAREYFDTRYRSGKISYHTWRNHLSRIRSFQTYLMQSRQTAVLAIQDLTPDLVHAYRQHCLSLGNSPVSVNRKIQPLLQVIRPFLREGHDFGDVPSSQAGPGPVRYLSGQELDHLVKHYHTLPEGKDKSTLEVFLFSFHACGLRISDIVTLEWQHIDWKNGVLSKIAVKSRSFLAIPLSAPALDILRRRQDRMTNKRFVFNLLPEDFQSREKGALENAIDNRNRAIRQRLNRIGKALHFSFPLGMHVARHTFAVQALNTAGVDVHLISRLLGHSSVTVTEKVYATFLLSTLCEAVRSRLSFPEYAVTVENSGKNGG